MNEPVLLLAVDRIPCLRWNEKLKILAEVPDLPSFLRLRPAETEILAGRRLRDLVWKAETLVREAEHILRLALSRKIRLLPYTDPEYPPQLREIYDPPFLLYCRGKLPSWEGPALGIVGTRSPSGGGRKAAYDLAFEAAQSGILVVSGLARGIDGEAHRGCLDGGGITLTVLGNGADTVYPVSHRNLAARIIESGGLLLTEYEPGAGVRKFHFPSRNRILSGLCRGIVVVEAPAKSGALITADYALEQGRDLFVHRDCLAGDSGEGTRRLAAEGAPVVACLDDIHGDWYSAGMFKNDSPRPSDRRKNTILPLFASENPGKILAGYLEAELSGAMVRHQGDYIRRTEHG